MKPLLINGEDFKTNKTVVFSNAELKVIYNHFAEVIEDFPEMMTFQSVLEKIKERVEDDCEYCNFYGVEEINNIQVMSAEVVVDLNVQSTFNDEKNDMVIFFPLEKMDEMCNFYTKNTQLLTF